MIATCTAAMRYIAILCAVSCVVGGAAGALAAPKHAGTAEDHLADDAILARVDDRTITALEYVEAYFNVPGNLRPLPDSAGRVEFLNTVVKKEILAKIALSSGKALTFEDRNRLRKAHELALSNALYLRTVWDSVSVSDEEILAEYEDYKTALLVRRILLKDATAAEKLQRDLSAGRTTWDEASAAHSQVPESEPPMLQLKRHYMGRDLAKVLLPLQTGGISPVVKTAEGYVIYQLVARKEVDPPAFEGMKRIIFNEIQESKADARAVEVRERLATQIGVRYDSTNIAYAASFFPVSALFTYDERGPLLDMTSHVPHFANEDRSRVLARHRDGEYTLGEFVDKYEGLSRIARRSIGDFEGFRAQLDIFILEPYFVELAQRKGLETDPRVLADDDFNREKILVEHVYRDSVMAFVRVTEDDRREYYEAHRAEFVSTPRVRYAQFTRPTREAADRLAEKLRAGADPLPIVRADSAAGNTGSTLGELYEHERSPLNRLLFQELAAGEVGVLGPHERGDFTVTLHIERLPRRPVAYDEVRDFIDETLRNERSEARLDDLIARHRPGYEIEVHPELVTQVFLVDPVTR